MSRSSIESLVAALERMAVVGDAARLPADLHAQYLKDASTVQSWCSAEGLRHLLGLNPGLDPAHRQTPQAASASSRFADRIAEAPPPFPSLPRTCYFRKEDRVPLFDSMHMHQYAMRYADDYVGALLQAMNACEQLSSTPNSAT